MPSPWQKLTPKEKLWISRVAIFLFGVGFGAWLG